ncbi:MAG: RrF2 family transcriptional regulator [Fidelibacterota bacterium]
MLKVSTKGRYGLRLMVRLAKNYGKGPMLLSDISEQEDISLKYAEHLIRSLKKTGYLKSYRGATGGYELTVPPTEITARKIIGALEGDEYPVECIHKPEICKKTEYCPTREVWQKLENSIANTLDDIKLDQLLD